MRKLTPILVAVVFLAGFIMMVLEVVGARFLTKYFGSAFHVWVSQIGVVLIALAAGYWLGGALTDRSGRLTWASGSLWVAGLWTLAIPWFADPLIRALVRRHPADAPIPPLWQKLDPVLGSALVFLVPCLALAMLSPGMIRLATISLAHVGRVSGTLIGGGTLGSILGVFMAGYVLIEHLGMTRIFQVMGGLTLVLAAVCVWLDRRWLGKGTANVELPTSNFEPDPFDVGRSALDVRGSPQSTSAEQVPPDRVRRWFRALRCWGLAIGWLGCDAGGHAAAVVVYETTSVYHHIQVSDEGGLRSLKFDGAEESRMSLADPLRGHFEYTEFFHLPWLWNTNITRVLMVGLGGSSAQRAYEHDYPQVTIETAELDPAVLRVAKEYFHFKESPRQIVQLEDGRVFLTRSNGAYDVIVMDAYTANRYGAYVPFHLVTKEFFEIASQHLTTNGVLCYNLIGTVQGQQSDLMAAAYRTLHAVFPRVYLLPARESMNVVLVATRSAELVTFATLQQRALRLGQTGRVRLPTFPTRLQAMVPKPAHYDRALVLTDDYAPTDGLLRVFTAPPQ